MSDDITGIFDHLTPEDFFDPDTSAQLIPISETYTFDEFVEQQMVLLRYAFAACDGSINPMIALVNDNTVIIYQANDDENIGQYVKRMGVEAKRIGARWAFFYKKTLVATRKTEETLSATGLMAGADEADAWTAVYWYASRVDGEEPAMRHGYATIDNTETKLGEFAEGPLQPNEVLSKILEP
jgi:hypothetical protein